MMGSARHHCFGQSSNSYLLREIPFQEQILPNKFLKNQKLLKVFDVRKKVMKRKRILPL